MVCLSLYPCNKSAYDIGHESSVGVAGQCLVLVFAATFSEMALQSVYPWNRTTQRKTKCRNSQ